MRLWFFLQFLLWPSSILCFLPVFIKFNSFAEINLYLVCAVTIKYNSWLPQCVLLMSCKKFSLLSLLYSWLHSHCINEHLKTYQCQFLLICSGFQIALITTRKWICWWKVKIKKWWISENCISIAPFSEVNIGDSIVKGKEDRMRQSWILLPHSFHYWLCEFDGVNVLEPQIICI